MEHASDLLQTSALDERHLYVVSVTHCIHCTPMLVQRYIINRMNVTICRKPPINYVQKAFGVAAIGTCRPKQGFSLRFNRKHSRYHYERRVR